MNSSRKVTRKVKATGLAKAPTGIEGLDGITGGGLPRGRATLLCGSAGCGKTLMGMEFLMHGAMRYGEPGVFMAFEETSQELTQNVRSLGYDVDQLVRQKKVVVDFVRIDRHEIEETGDYNLDGLFVRLAHAIDTIGAKRVVLDTIEALFSGLTNQGILRAELRRLFGWLKGKGVTAVITAERGDGQLTRNGLEEYVSDCVILLDHRVIDQISTRRLRVVKYRGTSHGTNEYPFLIDQDGITVFPITSLTLTQSVSRERVSTGVPPLDAMLGGGYFRGSSILVSGAAGCGKTSLAAHLVDAACGRGRRCLFFSFEESQAQVARNMHSIGLDLDPWVKKGLLRFHPTRSTMHGLEMHLAIFHKLVTEFKPHVVVFDPINNLVKSGSPREADAMLTRLVDFLKSQQVTAFMTTLTGSGQHVESTDMELSSMVDTWLLLRDVELDGERNRALYILKSRGMAHSSQVREFLLTSRGIDLQKVHLGPEGVLTGSARRSHESRQVALARLTRLEIEGKERELEQKRRAFEARVRAMQSEFQAEESQARRVIDLEKSGEDFTMARLGPAGAGGGAAKPPAHRRKAGGNRG